MRQFLFSKKELLPLISFLLLLNASFGNFHFPCLILWITTRWLTRYCVFVCLFVCPRFVQLLLAIWTKWLVMAPHYWRRHSNPKRVTNIEDIAQNCTQSGKLWRYGAKLQLHLLECAFKNLSTPSPLFSPPPFCSDSIIILYKHCARSGIMLSISDDILMRYLEARALKKSWDKHCNVINFIPIWLYSTFKECFCFFFFF